MQISLNLFFEMLILNVNVDGLLVCDELACSDAFPTKLDKLIHMYE